MSRLPTDAGLGFLAAPHGERLSRTWGMPSEAEANLVTVADRGGVARHTRPCHPVHDAGY